MLCDGQNFLGCKANSGEVPPQHLVGDVIGVRVGVEDLLDENADLISCPGGTAMTDLTKYHGVFMKHNFNV